MPGIPSFHVWNPTCVRYHIPCLESHPMSGTLSPCLKPHPMSETPSLVWNPIPMCGIPPHVWNPPLVWNPITCLISHPQWPHSTILPPVPLPPSGPCCPCLAPNCPLPAWSGPRLSPIWNSYPLPPSSYPHPIKYHHQSSPPPKKEIWGFLSFPSFPMFISISSRINLTSRINIFHFASKNSQNSHAVTLFPSIRYLYESPTNLK